MQVLGGIHWPADDIHGRALGEHVGENAWQRARQFVFGTASPAAAVLAFLRPPFWFRDSDVADASFQTAGGLGVNLPAGGHAMWRSIIVDPMPAGNYELNLKLTLDGGHPLRVCIGIAAPTEAAPLGTLDTVILPSSSAMTMTVPWTSDGIGPFRISIVVRADTGGGGQMLVSAMSAARVWPVAAGSHRYYEMSAAGLADR